MLTGEVPFSADSQVGVAMKHVNEEPPDVQRRRPGVSAAAALVVERATLKAPERRYQRVDEMIADLETALEVEAARAGSTSGEATSVLDAVPPPRRRLARGVRWSWSAFALLLAVAAVVLALVYGISSGWFGGGGAGAGGPAGGGMDPVKVTSATDYDPLGTGGEHSDLTSNAIDDNPAITGGAWTTETYDQNFPEGKEGVGIYLTTAAPAAAKSLQVRSAKGGWDLQVYGAPSAPRQTRPTRSAGGHPSARRRGWGPTRRLPWTPAGEVSATTCSGSTKLASVGSRYRVEITDARLFD